MSSILRAVAEADLEALVIYPNSDRGHSGVIDAIDQHIGRAQNGCRVKAVKSLSRDEYLESLCRAKVLVGNSSSGVIEAPVIGTASVNVGSRQAGRLRAGSSVIDSNETLSDIRRVLARALRKRPRRLADTPYGDGQAGIRIAEVLAGTPLSEAFRRKKNTF